MGEKFKSGQIIKHFKRELITNKDSVGNKYFYKVLGVAQHTETGEQILIYEALYPPYSMFARPLELAEGKVDKEKYPTVQQEDIFEIISFKE